MTKHKSLALFTLMLFIGFCSFAQKSTDDFSGKWKTEEGNIIEISKNGTGFIGMGTIHKQVIVKDLQFKDNKWVSEITNPIKNITANGEFLLDGNKIKIVARKSIFSKTIYWTKQ
ncbi:MAG: hypothetical protein NTZ19_10765 [Bacteroidetes bacterium]|nr:hypothetical protein [Bacteroidota bacterium]